MIHIGFRTIIFPVVACAITILPFQFHYSGVDLDIFPALEICVLYFMVTYRKMSYITLFPLGILVDGLSGLPILTNAIAFTVCGLAMNYTATIVNTRKYNLNLLIMPLFAAIIIVLRLFSAVKVDSQSIGMISLLLYIATTCFSYPIIRSILMLLDQKPYAR